MANYAITDHATIPGTIEEVLALLETYLETIDDAKTIYLLDIKMLGSAKFQGVVIHSA